MTRFTAIVGGERYYNEQRHRKVWPTKTFRRPVLIRPLASSTAVILPTAILVLIPVENIIYFLFHTMLTNN
jgi:hypothetical protein